ncbi:MAG: hypothetical protein JST26_04655 [Bacteroidetes bacterium]|nr:hypothetical protein [Bacteroidota bacterium]
MPHGFSLYIACICFFRSLVAPAQQPCSVSDTVHFERIFGADKLLTTGADTIYSDHGNRIMYSCWTCDICCLNSKGRLIWRRDLSSVGCHLLAFRKMPANKKGRSGKQNVVIQTSDKRIFILKVKRGKLRQVKW